MRLRLTLALHICEHILAKTPLCRGDYSVADFQLAYINLDDENEGKLSKAKKVLRAKRRWALDDLQLQTNYVLVCVCACSNRMLNVLLT